MKWFVFFFLNVLLKFFFPFPCFETAVICTNLSSVEQVPTHVSVVAVEEDDKEGEEEEESEADKENARPNQVNRNRDPVARKSVVGPIASPSSGSSTANFEHVPVTNRAGGTPIAVSSAASSPTRVSAAGGRNRGMEPVPPSKTPDAKQQRRRVQQSSTPAALSTSMSEDELPSGMELLFDVSMLLI